jgi:hypothetical protein
MGGNENEGRRAADGWVALAIAVLLIGLLVLASLSQPVAGTWENEWRPAMEGEVHPAPQPEENDQP